MTVTCPLFLAKMVEEEGKIAGLIGTIKGDAGETVAFDARGRDEAGGREAGRHVDLLRERQIRWVIFDLNHGG